MLIFIQIDFHQFDTSRISGFNFLPQGYHQRPTKSTGNFFDLRQQFFFFGQIKLILFGKNLFAVFR